MKEVWKPIEGYEGLYDISNLGRVKSLPKQSGSRLNINSTIMRLGSDKNGYSVISLSKNGKYKLCKVHRLVGQAFIPNPENKPCINHKNLIKNDNAFVNLEWVTIYENSFHSSLHGKNWGIGEKNNSAKLSDDDIRAIKHLSFFGYKARHLYDMFGVSKNCIQYILNNEKWQHVTL